ncbi:caspase-14-like [Strongylocentrotus purpuratus]|uniref:Caspase family p20 domain-containing protein n=1 Tax=Strongylocentrotus purpuratus TaxID=7668 RepID=A0A7M7GRH2_STRPU|nr:caspase-14-like [Strongylocentrotus purpuratus]|eukprot:XP_003730847.1 PREDICTED: caspase-14-like [Strongylocentrotus purpuratus]
MSEARVGSHLDVGKIDYVFKEIGFKNETCSDLTAKQFEDELEKFVTSPKHEGMCSAVFVIMAHGNETGIQCKNKHIVTMKFIMDKVNTMKHMNGKPKIIFFQCCRGDYQRAYYQVTLCVAAGKPVPPALYQPRPIEELMEEEVFYDSTCIF